MILLVYLLTVLWFTVLNRSTTRYAVQLEPFWSYERWLAGDMRIGGQILANIAMFMPLGFLATALLSSVARLRRFVGRTIVVILIAAVFSSIIEALQLFLMRGLFEWDDLISNTLGALLGCVIYTILERRLNARRLSSGVTIVGLAVVIACVAVFFCWHGTDGPAFDATSKGYCFQVDEAALSGDQLTLTGFAFRYDFSDDRMSLVLKPSAGKPVKLVTQYGAARPEVNAYFLCDRDYTNTGFSATGRVDPDTEYEIMIQWPWSMRLPTGVYVTGGDIHYAPSDDFEPPDSDGARDLAAIVERGTLRVYRPDCHCWVYQLDGALYWIVDSDFNFEEDGTTYIQYQMWTTQIQNLPEERLAHNHFWDNIGGHFEKYELSGDFGPYRVMRRELPTAYSLTSIVTGYYKKGEWIWRNYFRPIYALGR